MNAKILLAHNERVKKLRQKRLMNCFVHIKANVSGVNRTHGSTEFQDHNVAI